MASPASGAAGRRRGLLGRGSVPAGATGGPRRRGGNGCGCGVNGDGEKGVDGCVRDEPRSRRAESGGPGGWRSSRPGRLSPGCLPRRWPPPRWGRRRSARPARARHPLPRSPVIGVRAGAPGAGRRHGAGGRRRGAPGSRARTTSARPRPCPRRAGSARRRRSGRRRGRSSRPSPRGRTAPSSAGVRPWMLSVTSCRGAGPS